jgi:hypothetical protein
MEPSSQSPGEASELPASSFCGIEGVLPSPPAGCLNREDAARRFGVAVGQLEEYTGEGLLISLKSSSGDPYYTDRDCEWCNTIKRLRAEAHLSFARIRSLITSRCTCWKFRHCGFQGGNECPVTSDASQPCWVNRARWSVLVSYPCYCCIVYRSVPKCEALRAVLDLPLKERSQRDDCGGG